MASVDAGRPDCSRCRWQGTIPGDAHLRCRHPLVDSDASVVDCIIGVIEGRYREAARKLHITAHFTGIKNGWFLWPANFDPIWLLTCEGFEPKEAGHGQEKTGPGEH